MSSTLEIVSGTQNALATPADLGDVAAYVSESLAPNTRRAYRSAVAVFRAWCEAEGLEALPASPETVAAFLAAEAKAGRSVSTLGQRVAALRWLHEAAGLPNPTEAKLVRATLKGLREMHNPDDVAARRGKSKKELLGAEDES